MTSPRLSVRKTYKLFIDGVFCRSESGRTFAVPTRGVTVHAARASRKDARDAVRAARTAFASWRDRSGYNRGQILYRLAEMLESRNGQLLEALRLSGVSATAARAEVQAAIDRAVWYAGWCDKIEQVLSTKNPVGIKHFNVSSPEPTGVVALVAPSRPGLLGLVSPIAAAACSGNTVVALASERDPHSAVALAEAVAVCDMPQGVISILTGHRREVVPTLAAHLDVNALDLWMSGPEEQAAALRACDNVKRVRRPGEPPARYWSAGLDQRLESIAAFVEIKTVWHPVGF
ncbi:MAG: aldehyde dehydrogenase family protein [Candidatus Eremiobacteraeota bacterium]|nr:aldehyde dehydrogenase family protein [Candidatus Eremiobacteraeota bacterium]